MELAADLELEAAHGEVVGQDVEHAHHLGEDEHAVAGVLESTQQLVQQEQLAAPANQLLGNELTEKVNAWVDGQANKLFYLGVTSSL